MATSTPRHITDSRTLAALAHPLRRRLVDLLRVDGPATASMLAGRTGQAVGNISHHVRTLADVGLIEEAPELARDRRERWWRLVAPSVRWSSTDFGGDAAGEAVAYAVESMNLDRQAGFVRAFRSADPAEQEWWADNAFSTDAWLRVTPAELGQFAAEMIALVARWSNREIPADGQERRPVFAFARGVPARP
jgi:DNA-binding transcriptional ArsR family regulator